MHNSRMNDEVLPDQVALMCRLTYAPLLATVAGAAITTLAMGPSVSVAFRPGYRYPTH
jgi:hypothetical protein